MKRHRWRLGACIIGTLIVVLALWPPGLNGSPGGPAEAARYKTKQMELLSAITHGAPKARQSFTEAEVNAYLNRLLDKNAQVRETRGLRVGIEEMHFDVAGEHASFYVAGRLLAVPFVLEYRVAGQTGKVGSVRLGLLPLVQPLKWMALGHLNRLSGGIRPERRILENLQGFELGDDTIQVTVAPSEHLAAGSF